MYDFPDFVFLLPVFVSFIIILLMTLCIVIFQQNKFTKLLNGFSLGSILVICFFISALTLYMSGYIVDEYNLSGDTASFNMFLVIFGLCIVNLIVYLKRNTHNKK